MISIAKLNSVDYLFKHSQHEYFTEQDNEKGYFAGRLTKYQKLEGKEADEKNFRRFCSYGGEKNNGIELDPAPPKDWSLLINIVSEEERQKLTEAWDRAIKEVCKAIEHNTYYRKTEQGKTEYKLAKGVALAVFNHHTARPSNGLIDPQEHSHIVIFPKVLGENNAFYSHTWLEAKYEHNQETLKYIDSIFQYSLSKSLNQLGYTVTPDKKGNFQIDGISQEMRQFFSKRTNKINEKAGEQASYNDKKKISLKQRSAKEGNDLAELRKEWQAKLKEFGLDEKKLATMKGKQLDKSESFEAQLQKSGKILSIKGMKILAFKRATFKDASFEDEYKAQNKKHVVELAPKRNHRLYVNLKNPKIQPIAATLRQAEIKATFNKATGRKPQPAQAAGQGAGKISAITTNQKTSIKLKILEQETLYQLKYIEIMSRAPSVGNQEAGKNIAELMQAMSDHQQTLNQLLNQMQIVASQEVTL